MDKQLPVYGFSAILIASEVLTDHLAPHYHFDGPLFPIPAWGQQTLVSGTSTSTSTWSRW